MSEEEGRPPGAEEVPAEEPTGEAGAEARQYDSLYHRIQKMSVSERIGLALKGDKEARALLIKDANKLVQVAVVSSPRIGDAEIVAVAKSRSVHDEVLRRVANTKEWFKNYEVRHALVQNPRTPLPIAIKLIPTLNARDLNALAKSKNVPSAIASVARRLAQSKKA